MPSKKGSVAYENRLARRRAKRAITRLQKELDSGSLSRAEQVERHGQIALLNEAIMGTYIGRRGHEIRTEEEAKEAARYIVQREYTEITTDLQSKNAQVQYEIGNTYYVDKVTKQHVQNPLSSYSEAEMRTFWKATQNIWNRQGVAREGRFAAIMSYISSTTGAKLTEIDLREFIDAVLADKKDEVAAWQREIDKKNAQKAAGVKNIGTNDEVTEFSSEDIVSYVSIADIEKILDAYRNIYGSEDETQEE